MHSIDWKEHDMSFLAKLAAATVIAAALTGPAAAGTDSSQLDPWAQHQVARQNVTGPLDPWAQHLVARAAVRHASPDDRPFSRSSHASAPASITPGVAKGDEGFDGATAGAGFGAGVALALLAVGASTIAIRRRRPAAL